jgi:hypothetical protein
MQEDTEMNCIVCDPTDTSTSQQKTSGYEYEAYGMGISTGTLPIEEDCYATAPIPVFKPLFQQPNEAELHTSFEEAISDRVLSVNRQLSRLSGPHSNVQQVQSQTGRASEKHQQPQISALLQSPWQQSLLLISVALMLVLLGFDLMGLLVLHVH